MSTKKPRVLIACEFSGIVREAFRAQGCYALSVDFEPTEIPGEHYQGNVLDVLIEGWDLMIAHPPCTYTAVSGNRWLKNNPARQKKQRQALAFIRELMYFPDIPRICVEQPKSVVTSKIRKADQIIQPWQFGHGETKATHLWYKNLPPLVPTKIVSGREPRVHWEAPGRERAKNRSRTYPGIAEAMAKQWSAILRREVR